MYEVGQVLFSKPNSTFKSRDHKVEEIKTAVDSEGVEYILHKLSGYGVWFETEDLVNGFMLEKVEDVAEDEAA